jgi:methylphosphotriester-DNA--protein-cysteine methyltransferase
MIYHIDVEKNMHRLIRSSKIRFAGNAKLRIYGLLSCTSGKRMNIRNRVFFESIEEAEQSGYRPCGHCMRKEYKRWKFACSQTT